MVSGRLQARQRPAEQPTPCRGAARGGAPAPDPLCVLDDREFKGRQRAMWALGDYHRFATATLWQLGPLLVEACEIGPGQRVLDVAAGSGNVAIRAAECGAHVIASDLTPENFAAGRREARARGVDLDWIQADAEALPFADASFDVVTSAVGAIFAPHHQTVADELLRVCRPGGAIGLVAIAPGGAGARLFEVYGHHARLPLIDMEAVLEWGREAHVRELFGDRVASLRLERQRLAPIPVADLEPLRTDHPAFVALYRDLAAQPDQVAALDRDLADALRRHEGEPQELLLIVARKRDGRTA
jgi:SAM-dependent methyltransferase